MDNMYDNLRGLFVDNLYIQNPNARSLNNMVLLTTTENGGIQFTDPTTSNAIMSIYNNADGETSFQVNSTLAFNDANNTSLLSLKQDSGLVINSNLPIQANIVQVADALVFTGSNKDVVFSEAGLQLVAPQDPDHYTLDVVNLHTRFNAPILAGDITASNVAVSGSLTAESVALTGALTTNSATVPTITASNTSTSNATVSESLTAGTATVTGTLAANNVAVTGAITAASTALTGALTATTATVPTITASNTSTSNATVSDSLTAATATVTADLTVGGNLIVNGATTTIDTQTLLIEDNIIVLNKNQTGTPSTILQSGIEVERGDQPNYSFVFDEATDLFKVGMTNSLQAVMTRDDALTSGYPYFEPTQSKLINRAFQTADFNDNLITTRLITDSNVTSAKIGANTIVSANIAPSAVGTIQLTDSNVTATKHAANSVLTVHISDSNVTSAKIADPTGTGRVVLSDSPTITGTAAISKIRTNRIAVMGGKWEYRCWTNYTAPSADPTGAYNAVKYAMQNMTPTYVGYASTVSTIGDTDNFSTRWFGYFTPTVSGTYTFSSGADDSAMIWIGDSAAIPETSNTTTNYQLAPFWNGSSYGPYSYSVALTADVAIPILIYFSDASFQAGLGFSVTPPGGSATSDLSPYIQGATMSGNDATFKGTVTASNISVNDQSIAGSKIADSNVTAAKLAANSVLTVHIANSNVTSAKIGANTIVSANIAPGAVGTSQLAAFAVDNTKLANGAVGTTQLAANAVDGTKIAASAVGTTQLANNAVDNTKLANGAVGTTQLAANAVDNTKIAPSAVGTTQLANNAVDSTKIAPSAVGATQLATDAVTTVKILNASVTQPKLAVDAVATTNIANGAVISTKIANAAVGTVQLADSNVTSAKIGANTIVAANIASAAVTSAKILDSNVQANHLNLPIYHGTRHTPSYISTTETQYPPAGMGGLTTTFSGQPYGNGTYVNISANQLTANVNFWRPGWYAFDYNPSTYTLWTNFDYTINTGVYFGSMKKRYIDKNGDVQIAKGEFYGLKLPVSVKPSGVVFTSPTYPDAHAIVGEYVYLGSKDGNVWYELDRRTITSWTLGETKTFGVSSTSPYINDVYNHLLVVPLSTVPKGVGGPNPCSFAEIRFLGYEYTPSPGDGIVTPLVPAPTQTSLALGNAENPWETLNMKQFVQIPESLTYNFPPISNASASAFTLAGQSYGNGDYVLTASSVAPSTNLHAVLNDTMGEQWTSASVYNLDGSYAGATQTLASGTTYSGEWIQLKLPYAIQLTSYQMRAPTTAALVKYTTQSWVVLGSADGTTWTLIDDQQVSTWATTPNQTFYAVNTKKYQYYRVVCLRSGSDTAGPNPVIVGFINLKETIPRYRKVGLGTMTPSNALDVIGDVYVSGMLKGPSDLRLKTDLAPIPNALDKIASLTGYTFLRTDLADGRRRTGLIAQDVERVLPEVVDRDPATDRLSMSYAEMMGLIVEGIKELKDLYLDLRANVIKN